MSEQTKIRTKNVCDKESLIRANEDAGRVFFSRKTMKFFASRVLEGIWKVGDYVLFCTSEKKCFDNPTREYSVRVMDPEGHVMPGRRDTYGTAPAAKRAAREYSKSLTIPKTMFEETS